MRFIFLVFSFLISSSSVYAESCNFTLEKDSLGVSWTAYKTTQKAAVPGVFRTLEIKGRTESKTLKKLMEGITAQVDLGSADTKNPERDKTLHERFFALLKPSIVTGKFKNISEIDGKADLVLNFNGRKNSVPVTYKYDEQNGEITATGSMDILKFKAEKAFNSLHEACAQLHTGSDGVSKTWSEVSIELKARITKLCK